jgi:hypothetical protein
LILDVEEAGGGGGGGATGGGPSVFVDVAVGSFDAGVEDFVGVALGVDVVDR